MDLMSGSPPKISFGRWTIGNVTHLKQIFQAIFISINMILLTMMIRMICIFQIVFRSYRRITKTSGQCVKIPRTVTIPFVRTDWHKTDRPDLPIRPTGSTRLTRINKAHQTDGLIN